MSILLEAYSPAEGKAIIRKDNQLVLLEPPYRKDYQVNINSLPDNEKTFYDAVYKYGFFIKEQAFDNWESIFSFLRAEIIQVNNKRGLEIKNYNKNDNTSLNLLPLASLQRLLDKVEHEQIPQGKYEYAKNFLEALLSTNTVKQQPDLHEKAESLLNAVNQKRAEIDKNQSPIELSPEANKQLHESMKHLTFDGQVYILNWLKSGMHNKDWDVKALFNILSNEPLELIDDDDIDINIVAQVLKTAVVLFEPNNYRILFRSLVNHLKALNERKNWDDVFFELASKFQLPAWAVESLPKLIIVTDCINGDMIIKTWYFFAFFIRGKFNIIDKKNKHFMIIRMTEKNYQQNKENLLKIEKNLLGNPFLSPSGRKTVKLHIITHYFCKRIGKKINFIIEQNHDIDNIIYENFRSGFLNKKTQYSKSYLIN